ncbi:MAG: DUF1232 domain-containing protein [Candidatus Peregrinibacteria bacterium]|nr:DUF1232 domain-containing protein [Candidatus Peregrinibacteria bacterium]
MPRLSLGQKFRVMLLAAFDERTSLRAKLLLAAGVLYGLSPIDVIPDLLPLLGFTDDATVLIFAILYFLRKTRTVRAEIAKKEHPNIP